MHNPWYNCRISKRLLLHISLSHTSFYYINEYYLRMIFCGNSPASWTFIFVINLLPTSRSLHLKITWKFLTFLLLLAPTASSPSHLTWKSFSATMIRRHCGTERFIVATVTFGLHLQDVNQYRHCTHALDDVLQTHRMTDFVFINANMETILPNIYTLQV